MKEPCLISFDLFLPSFGDGLGQEWLSVRCRPHERHSEDLLEHMPHAQARRVLPIKESVIRLSTADNDPGYHPTNLKTHINIAFFHHDYITCKRKKLKSSSMSASSRTRTTRMSATSTRPSP